MIYKYIYKISIYKISFAGKNHSWSAVRVFYIILLGHVSLPSVAGAFGQDVENPQDRHNGVGLWPKYASVFYGCWSKFLYPHRPFFANINVTFTALSQTPCLSFAEPMLATAPLMKIYSPPAKLRQLENHRSLLDSLVNMQLSSRNPFSPTFESSGATYEGQGDCPKAPHRKLNQNQTEILRCPSPGQQGAAALYKLNTMIINNIQLSRNFRESWMFLSRTRKKLLRGFPT
jgi:hypothetical protein